MSKQPWKPWHQVVQLRDDLKSGELSLNIFAADLYDVAMQKGKRPVYEDPTQFFALTYPTYNLRELAKDVVIRLAGKSEKAIRQLELTYGGGKTHTLITLFHLVNNPDQLPDLPAVHEFIQHIGITPPQARVATLSFDKLDAEKGMEVRSPDNELRWLKNPWSVLAFQLAGTEGLRLLHAEERGEERESAPAENLLIELLSLPAKENFSTLILIDEVLMYAREKVGFDPVWRSRIINFFQYLTQAATKVDRCAIVASLLATDPSKSDTLGKELTQELYAIFRREREEGVQPVVKEDVAEVLRRRLFTTDSIRDRESFRSHVVAALKGISAIDEQTRKEGNLAEERFIKSYPFHPDLTEIFYTKWTNLEGFQRTRGVLRTFALALRDAEKWDESPLIAANVFIGQPGKVELSEAARELTNIATSEEYEGKRQEWNSIIEGELAKARDIQLETVGIKFREIEQAVFCIFLHSQPIGQKVLTRELMLLLGQTRPDKIELEKALLRWVDVSWFLDEDILQDTSADISGQKQLPKSWRLGSKPNLKQMHHDACKYRVSAELVDTKLLEEIGKFKSLTAGASAAGAKVHNLPKFPKDIEDDGEFHYAVLKPSAASDSGKPSSEAKRFLDEKTDSNNPRVYRNSVVLAVPSRDGLEAARSRIRDYLGWEEVRTQLEEREVDSNRKQRLDSYLSAAKNKIGETIQQAYCIVVTVSERNEVQAFKITIKNDESLFNLIKADGRSRIQETAITAEALLPGGPYDLWREDEPSRRIKDLVRAFAQFPRLPKMLNHQAILDTLIEGCVTGTFVLRLTRSDLSVKTFWRVRPDEIALKEQSLEATLPESAILTELLPSLLLPGELPELWQTDTISLKDLYEYFSGQRVVMVPQEGYEEPLTIPQAERAAIETAICTAVQNGQLWLTSGVASLWSEDIPAGLLTDDAQLQAPPPSLSITDILPPNLPDAWSHETTTALDIAQALGIKVGKQLPWKTVRDVIDGTFRSRLLERTLDSGPWPCDYAGAVAVKLQLPQSQSTTVEPSRVVGESPSSYQINLPVPKLTNNVLVAETNLQPNQIQDLADAIVTLKNAVEAIAVKVATAYEEDQGASVVDVSKPDLATVQGLSQYPGFDLFSKYPNGQQRSIEVKGRADRGDVELTENEWEAARQLGNDYWLYVVFDCASSCPKLLRIQDPYGTLMGKTKTHTLIEEREIRQATAEQPQVVESYSPTSGLNILATKAVLQVNQIQDLADALPEIKNATAGIDLKFRLRIELGGKSRPPQEAIDLINQLLRDISEDLELK
jgi:hypothetical protein